MNSRGATGLRFKRAKKYKGNKIMSFDQWEILFEEKIRQVATNEDPAHDILHFKRVVKLAKTICISENGNLNVVLPAAWLHDFVIVPKNSPLRSQASQLSAAAAIEFLKSIQYPEEFFKEIEHAIAGHSFSANLPVMTLEAQIIQDADRLDGLGAIGVARCFATAGLLKRSFYSEEDPFCEMREPNDMTYTIDHFYKKLFIVSENLKTETGKNEGLKRVQHMKQFLNQFKYEV